MSVRPNRSGAEVAGVNVFRYASSELPGGDKVSMRIVDENGALRLWVSSPDESRRLLYQGDNVFLLENAPGFVFTFVVVHDAVVKFTVRKPCVLGESRRHRCERLPS